MVNSTKQFAWIPKGRLESKSLDYNYFPFGLEIDLSGIESGGKPRARTITEMMETPKSVHCTEKGRLAYIATAEGFIERFLLSMLANDNEAHARLEEAAAEGDSAVANMEFSGFPFSLGSLSKANVRKMLTDGNRQRNLKIFNALLWFPASTWDNAKSISNSYRTIFTPTLSVGEWNGSVWSRVYPTLSFPVMSVERGVQSTTVQHEFGDDSNAPNRFNTVAFEQNFESGNVTETTSDITRFIASRIDATHAIDTGGFKENATDDEYVSSYLLMTFMSPEFFRVGSSGFQNLHYSLYALLSPQYNHTTVMRLSMFHWSALNSFLCRFAHMGVQGSEGTYYVPLLAETRWRTTFKNLYAARTVTLGATFDATRQEFDVGYVNGPAEWSEVRYEHTASAHYFESHGEGREGGLDGAWEFVLSTADWSRERLSQLGELIQSPNNPDVSILHISGDSLKNYLLSNAAYITNRYSVGGSLSFTKSFSAAVQDGVYECDAEGLDSYPCDFSVSRGYVHPDALVCAVGKGRLYNTYLGKNQKDPVALPINSDCGPFKLSLSRKDSIKAAMEACANRMSIDSRLAQEKYSNLLNTPSITNQDTILSWMNSFEFGSIVGSTQAGDIEAYYKNLLMSRLRDNDWDAEYPYYDLYFTDDPNNADSLVFTRIDAVLANEPHFQDTEEYRSYTFTMSDDEGYFSLLTKAFDFDSSPNRTNEMEDWSFDYEIPCWLIMHTWQWKAMDC